MREFRTYLLENVRWLAVILCIALVMVVTMLLNGISLWEIGYGVFLWIFVTTLAVLTGYRRYCAGLKELEWIQKNVEAAPCKMKIPEYLYERQYQACIDKLAHEKNRLQNELTSQQKDLTEYYSMWVHQIKTPIAALKLLLDEEMNVCLETDDAEENDTRVRSVRQKQNELFRIEQYVDMALQYTRLGAQTNDFVIESVLLDEVIRQSVHKYAKQFISKQLRLTYEPQEIRAVTDRKWLGFVIDQLLANAVKYTKQGGVTIRVSCCVLSDSGAYDSGADMGAYEGRSDMSVNEERPDMGANGSESDSVAVATQERWYDRAARKTQERVHIIIEDTGIGIRAEDLPRVCEKGYTGYNGHDNQYSTGIGLYLCKAILDKLGHRIILTSERGKGTRVEVVIG